MRKNVYSARMSTWALVYTPSVYLIKFTIGTQRSCPYSIVEDGTDASVLTTSFI